MDIIYYMYIIYICILLGYRRKPPNIRSVLNMGLKSNKVRSVPYLRISAVLWFGEGLVIDETEYLVLIFYSKMNLYKQVDDELNERAGYLGLLATCISLADYSTCSISTRARVVVQGSSDLAFSSPIGQAFFRSGQLGCLEWGCNFSEDTSPNSWMT